MSKIEHSDSATIMQSINLQLGHTISIENACSLDVILLLRHSNKHLKELRNKGASVEEYTALQPKLSRYDFRHPQLPEIKFVCVIADDHVYGVFEVIGVKQEGFAHSLCTRQYLAYDHLNDDRDCRLFEMKPVYSVCFGRVVHGWEGRGIATVQRVTDGFFNEVTFDVISKVLPRESVENEFSERVKAALRVQTDKRNERLALAPRFAQKRQVMSWSFDRNPDVVAAVLVRACGCCEACGKPAPFNRKSDGTPFLEVHHRVTLADGGEDTVANAFALCPNCHRAAHHANDPINFRAQNISLGSLSVDSMEVGVDSTEKLPP